MMQQESIDLPEPNQIYLIPWYFNQPMRMEQKKLDIAIQRQS
jgi:hypothetical protein